MLIWSDWFLIPIYAVGMFITAGIIFLVRKIMKWDIEEEIAFGILIFWPAALPIMFICMAMVAVVYLFAGAVWLATIAGKKE